MMAVSSTHARIARGLGFDQPAERLRTQQRRIAVQHQQVPAQAGQLRASHRHRVARALLLLLLDESDSRRGDGLAHLVGLVAHHHENPLGRRQLQGRVHHVLRRASCRRARCSTLACRDFMRVPSPAARMTTVRGVCISLYYDRIPQVGRAFGLP